jgi:hypothetical protein
MTLVYIILGVLALCDIVLFIVHARTVGRLDGLTSEVKRPSAVRRLAENIGVSKRSALHLAKDFEKDDAGNG